MAWVYVIQNVEGRFYIGMMMESLGSLNPDQPVTVRSLGLFSPKSDPRPPTPGYEPGAGLASIPVLCLERQNDGA